MVNLELMVNSMASDFFTPDGPTINPACTNYWPFPAECPPKPWTPEQQKTYEQQQRAKVPDAPM